MSALTFSECFWNTEFNTNAGFDTLVKRMRDARTSSKEIVSFIKERSKIEEEYGKSLLRLSRASLGTTDTGTFKDILNALKMDTEKASAVHADMSQSLAEQVQRIQMYKDNFSTRCKQAEAEVKKWQASKKDFYHKTQSSQQNYHKKCTLYESAHQAYATEKSSGIKPAKEMEKLENRSHRCKEDMLKADEIYKNLIKNLESVRVNWETEVQTACELFQQVDQERLLYFRNELWVHVNIDSKTLGDQDEMNEEARNVMEGSDLVQDIQDFIEKNQTGSSRPAAILYESGESKPTPKSLRAVKPVGTGSSTFFGGDVSASTALSDDDYNDPTYASVS